MRRRDPHYQWKHLKSSSMLSRYVTTRVNFSALNNHHWLLMQNIMKLAEDESKLKGEKVSKRLKWKPRDSILLSHNRIQFTSRRLAFSVSFNLGKNFSCSQTFSIPTNPHNLMTGGAPRKKREWSEPFYVVWKGM